ncbi:MAG: EamA family transporter [Gammaproteobacteria bacterium]|nr:EamA family transporter [Gammaproteobacteria bacterium]
MGWLPLTLVCALALASADALTKARLSDYSLRELTFVRLTLTGLILSPLVFAQPFPDLPWAFWGWIVATVPLEIVAMLLYMSAIRDHSLAYTVPYLAFTPVFVVLTGYVLLGETLSPGGFVGILLVVTGAWLLNLKGVHLRSWRSWLAPFCSIFHNRGSLAMLGAALLYGITSVGTKGAMQYMQPELFGPFYSLLVGLMLVPLLGLATPRAIGRVWRKPWAVLGTALLMGLMMVTHFIAITQVEVAYMVAVKRSSLLFGILYGALLFHETGLGRHLAAGSIIISGVLIIAWA